MNKLTLISILLLLSSLLEAKTIKYEFPIDKKTINFTGNPVEALAINNQIPGPTIEATVGDVLEVTFHNKMDTETSIHWHGVLLPNDQDGVPYLTTPPIQPHSSFTYRYPITHSGTYWYHSHTGLQEQQGIYGALVFHPEKEKIKADKDHVIVLSDWIDAPPETVLANIKKDGDYYALKKQSVQSWAGVLKNGQMAINKRLHSAWTRMGPMDSSDIGYDLFLANGQKESFLKAASGEKIRLRLVNAGASSYFNVEFSGGPMTIVAADGVDVEPLVVKRLQIATAETYDVIVQIPESKSYELRSTSIDGTGYSSVFIGQGDKVFAPNIPKPNLFLMSPMMMDGMKSMQSMSGMSKKMHGNHKMSFQNNDQSSYHYTNYDRLRAVKETNFSEDLPKRQVILNLTGNMERYIWSFNNKTLIEADSILIKKGEVVQFVLQNKTMMHHPIHLHGHFFRVLNGQGKRSPLKHTVNVPPMSKVIIEFKANEEKDWFFHCHNLYHMKNGMARVVSYEKTTQFTPAVLSKIAHDTWYHSLDITGLSNMTMGRTRTSNTRNALEIEYDYNYNKEYDVDVTYARNLTRFLDIYAGGNFERADKDEKPISKTIAGIHYVLPLLIDSDLRFNSKGKLLRLTLKSDVQLTERTKFEWSFNTNKEYRLSLNYELNKKVLLTTTYDSDFKWGAGLRIKL
jgi:FtsP/CotA-like multicopper oxidase with cupredoxin domain